MKFAHLTLVLIALSIAAVAQSSPKPKIRLVGVTDTVNNGYAMKMYEIEVTNRDAYSDELFFPSPALPPCGKNANSSRTWINIYNEQGVRLYGWCGINGSGELVSLKFNVPEGQPQPQKIFIDLVDRAEVRVLRSNKVTVRQL